MEFLCGTHDIVEISVLVVLAIYAREIPAEAAIPGPRTRANTAPVETDERMPGYIAVGRWGMREPRVDSRRRYQEAGLV